MCPGSGPTLERVGDVLEKKVVVALMEGEVRARKQGSRGSKAMGLNDARSTGRELKGRLVCHRCILSCAWESQPIGPSPSLTEAASPAPDLLRLGNRE
jgi:hypothetical protein